jgi:NAD+ diphosphatase
MVQDISPSVYHVVYQGKEPGENGLCFVFQGQEILQRFQGGKLCLPTFGELGDYLERWVYLFSIDDQEYYLGFLKARDYPQGYGWWNLRSNQRMKSKALHFAEVTGYHLYVWYRDNRFCGRCGGETKPDTKERMLRCTACGNAIYPKIAPAIIVAVTKGDQILLTRYQGRPYKGLALIAGFSEIGETAEDTVRREVWEEVGLRVTDIRYYGSQPWGVDSNLLLGFFARLEGEDTITMEQEELAQAAWYKREEIDLPADGYSLTNDMIQAFLRGDWD